MSEEPEVERKELSPDVTAELVDDGEVLRLSSFRESNTVTVQDGEVAELREMLNNNEQ